MSSPASHSRDHTPASGTQLDSVPIAVWTYDVDARLVSSTTRRPPPLDDVERYVRDVVADGEPLTERVPGPTAIQVVTVRPLTGADGATAGAAVTVRPSLRSASETDNLTRLGRELIALAETLPDVVVRYDREGRAIYRNRRLGDLVGSHETPIVGLRPTEHRLPGVHDMSDYERALMGVLATGEPGAAEIRRTSPDGSTFVHSVLIRAERDPAGEIAGAIAIGRDITELVETRSELVAREHEFRSLAENIPDLIIRYGPDAHITYVNDLARRHLRPDALDALDRLAPGHGPSPIGLRDAEEYTRRLCSTLATGEASQVEVELDRPDGEVRIHSVHIAAERDADGSVVGAIAIGRDVTELVRARRRAAAREREFRALADNATDLIARWDADGNRVYANPALARVHGTPSERLIGRRSSEEFAAVGRTVAEVIRDHQPRRIRETMTSPATGRPSVHDVKFVPEFDEAGELVSVLGIGRDITEETEQRDALERAARNDALTGTASRMVLYEALPDLIARCQSTGTLGALVLLDLDGFKNVNDQYGHRLGDLVLRGVADAVGGCVDEADLLIRLGGDEFVIVVPEIEHPADASLLAFRARAALADLVAVGDMRIPSLDACAGIAYFPQDGVEVDDLLAHADLALYRAKARGSGQVEHFRPELRVALERRAAIEHALRECDPDEQMSLHLQPICALGDNPCVWGFESLLRWNHPELGPLAPAEFIPIAEQCGEIIGIGRWVLRHAAEIAVAHNTGRARPLQFTVNVSSRQFTLGDIDQAVTEALALTACDPMWLTLELTESLLLEDLPHVHLSLGRLHELGVHLAIDDFGTGYSALQYLTRLDIDHVKIDKSFVHGIEHDRQRQEIVRAIVALADALGLGTVAEGIETCSQAEFLRSLGCDLGQGFLLAKPLHADEVAGWLLEHQHDIELVLGR